MSQFSNQFTASIEEAEITQFALHEKAGISQGALSRYASGDNRPPPDQLERLLKAFPAKHRVALLLAYLADDVPDSFRNLVEIAPATVAGVAEREPVYRTRMPKKLREAYEGLGVKALESPAVADSLIAIWGIIGPRR